MPKSEDQRRREFAIFKAGRELSATAASPLCRTYCPACGDIINTDDPDAWNGDTKNPMHRLCANQPKKTDIHEVWDYAKDDREDARLIVRAIKGGWIPDENIEVKLKRLEEIADNSTDARAKMKAIQALLDWRNSRDRQKVSEDTYQLQREQFEFNKSRLEEGKPTQILGATSYLEDQADSLIGEIGTLEARVVGNEPPKALGDSSGDEPDVG